MVPYTVEELQYLRAILPARVGNDDLLAKLKLHIQRQSSAELINARARRTK